MMKIDRKLDRGPQGTVDLAKPVHCQLDRFERLVNVVAIVGPAFVTHPGGEAQVSPPCVRELARLLNAGGTIEYTGRGKALHPLAAGAAEKLVDRHAERFPEDVPQRDVNRRKRCGGDLAPLEVRTAVHRLPEVLDAARILADQEAAEMLQHPLHGKLAPGDASFANTGDPLIRLDRDDELVTMPDFDRITAHPGNLHTFSSRPWFSVALCPINGVLAALKRKDPASVPVEAGP